MAYDTNISLMVDSSRFGRRFELKMFREYFVDIDLETDSDSFNFVIKNPGGVYTSLVSRFDPIDISINGTPCVKGAVDVVEYNWDVSDSYIHINGRDMAASLIDNDAVPCTVQNVQPSQYISSKCVEYGIPYTNIDSSIPPVDKLIIGCGETEMSIMSNLLMESRKRMWLMYDTMFVGEWSTNITPSYYFTRGVVENRGIPIKSLKLTEDGTTMKSEINIYGSNNDGEEKVVGTAKNDYMINKGIKRRMVKRSSNNDATSKYASNALRDVRDSFRDNVDIEITVRTGSTLILPNRTAHIIDTVTKINSVFFIKRVTYQKDAHNGSITTITMTLGDSAFEVLWAGQGTKSNGGITGTPNMTLSELVGSRKG